MCWAEKCCYRVPLDVACIAIGFSTFIFSAFITLSSIILVILEQYHHTDTAIDDKHYLQTMLQVDLNKTSIDIILVAIMLVGLFWMLFSVLLLAGIKKNKPNLVLSYFSYGILLTIMCLLSSLLLLLQNYWTAALIKIIVSLFYIHCLVVVHTVYELMLRGKCFGPIGHSRLDDEASIITSLEDNSSEQ